MENRSDIFTYGSRAESKVRLKIGLACVLLIYSALAVCASNEVITKENVNDFDENGWTPLMQVINQYYRGRDVGPEYLKEIESLLILGADPNLRSKNGRNDTAYTMCDRPPISAEIMKVLIRNGADVNQYNGRGNSNLIRVSENISLLIIILKAGLDPNGQLAAGIDTTYLQRLIRDEKYEAVKLLLEYGADPDKSSHLSNLPLLISFGISDLRIARLLIDHGATIRGKQLINKVLGRENSVDIIRLLIEKGSDINEIDGKGNTPLHIAYLGLSRGRVTPSLISFLISAGADKTKKNSEGKLPHEMQ